MSLPIDYYLRVSTQNIVKDRPITWADLNQMAQWGQSVDNQISVLSQPTFQSKNFSSSITIPNNYSCVIADNILINTGVMVTIQTRATLKII